MSRGFLTFNLTPERIRVYWVWANRALCPYRQREKVVRELVNREIASEGEKNEVEAFLAKVLGYLQEADERDFYRSLRHRGTSWSMVLWADRAYWSRGEDAYPPWWDEVWTLLLKFVGDFPGPTIPQR